jgi:hypothetical protein
MVLQSYLAEVQLELLEFTDTKTND